MLPLIPAVLLIVLHGPAGLERLAADGKLGPALKVLSSRSATASNAVAGKSDDRAKQRILALASDSRELSQLLAQALKLAFEAIEPDPAPQIRESAPAQEFHFALDRNSGSPEDGFFDCRRTRDGPLSA